MDSCIFAGDKILRHEIRPAGEKSKKHFYLVSWLGYGSEHDSWEPEETLQGTPVAIEEYWESISHL